MNARGRLGDATEALSLLIESDQRKARAHAEACSEMNTKRQLIQENVVCEERGMVEGQPLNSGPQGMVGSGQGWRAGGYRHSDKCCPLASSVGQRVGVALGGVNSGGCRPLG